MRSLTFTISKFSILFFLVLNITASFAQDTLFFKDKQKMVVMVKEVSQTEIQYKKKDLPDGPMYITGKNDIEKIVYKNGYAEIFKPEVTPAINEQAFVVYNTVNINTEKLTYADSKRRYGAYVSFIDRHPDPSRKDRLMRSAIEIRSLKRHQDGTRTGAIIFGGVAVGGALLYSAISAVSYQSNVDPVFAIPPALFGAFGLALGTTSIAIHIKLKKKREEFVHAYNE